MSETDKIPLPVRHALAALEILKAEDATLAESVRKILPGYAKTLAARDETVTVARLIDDARQGASFLKEATRQAAPAPLDFLARHMRAAGGPSARLDIPLSSADYTVDDSDQEELNKMLRLACKNGHTEIARDLIRRGATNAVTDGIIDAVCYGRTETLAMLFENGAPSSAFDAYSHRLFELATYYDHPETFVFLLQHIDAPPEYLFAYLKSAVQNRSHGVFDLLMSLGAHKNDRASDALFTAFNYDRPRAARILLEHGVRLHEKSFAHTCDIVLKKGCPELIGLLAGTRGLDAIIDAAGAYRSSYSSLDRGQARDTHYLSRMVADGNVQGAAALIGIGLDPRRFDDIREAVFHARLAAALECAAHWQKTVRCAPPAGLHDKDPALFKPRLFATLMSALEREGHSGETAHNYAYNIVALLQSEERVVQFMEKWGAGRERPFQQTCYALQLPKDTAQANLADWGDAVLKHGPKMAKLVKYCDRLPSPLKSDDGRTWSLAKTLAEVARFAYPRAAEHPALAAVCFEHSVSEDSFNAALAVAKHPPRRKNMPEIHINGVRFGMEGAVFRRLANDDVRGLFLGEFTDCCQSVGNHGDACARHGFTSEHGGFYAIETARGEIIGQSWAWRGRHGELCLDSLETLGDRVSGTQWKKLIAAVADDLTARKDHNVTALHIGMGGQTPRAIAEAFKTAAARPRDYKGYRDSYAQVRAWKR
jgi:hypothetical protein